MKVVVIGAGAVGLCSAWTLRQRGHEVVVVESGTAESDRCSFGNSGIIVPSHFEPLAAPGMVATGLKMLAKRDSAFRIKPSLDPDLARWCILFMKNCTREHVEACSPVLLELHLKSKVLFKEMADRCPDAFGYTEAGMVMVCTSEEGLEEEKQLAAQAARLGMQVDVLEGNTACRERIGVDSIAVGGVHYRDDAHVSPRAFVERLQEELSRAGVTLNYETRAQGWSAGIKALVTNHGEVEGDAFVVAAGTWSGELASSLGLDLPLQPGKGMNFENKGGPRPNCPYILKEARVAVTPMPGFVRFGGTLELGEWDAHPDKRRVAGMMKSIEASLPGTKIEDPNQVWTGFRPCSPDGMPYIGTFPEAENVVFATGHAMMGLSLAPVTGEMVADLIEGTANSDPRLAPGRFS